MFALFGKKKVEIKSEKVEMTDENIDKVLEMVKNQLPVFAKNSFSDEQLKSMIKMASKTGATKMGVAKEFKKSMS